MGQTGGTTEHKGGRCEGVPPSHSFTHTSIPSGITLYYPPQETHSLMLDKLQAQLSGAEWGWERLNTLCWAIGAISGTVAEEEAENKFLVSVIKDLLVLCETRGKDNKVRGGLALALLLPFLIFHSFVLVSLLTSPFP
jgi:hypothetical protein